MVTAEALIDERERFFQELRNNKTRFRDFLGAMAAHYRQPIARQVAIFFHAPAAGRAYGEESLWERFGTDLRHDAEGVPVLSADERSVIRLYERSETQDAGHPLFDQLVWTYDEARDGAALRRVCGAEEGQTAAEAVLAKMSRLREEGYSELELLGAGYLALERLGLDAEEHLGLPLILAPYENVDAEQLLSGIQRAARTILDPLAQEVRAHIAQEQEQEQERKENEHDAVYGERDGAADGASEERGGGARESGAGESGDQQSDGAVRGDELSVSGRGADAAGGAADREPAPGVVRGGDGAVAAGGEGDPRTGRDTAHTGTVGSAAEGVSPVLPSEGVGDDADERDSSGASPAGAGGDGAAVSDDVPAGGSTADTGAEPAGTGGSAAERDDRSAAAGDSDGRTRVLAAEQEPSAVDFSTIDYDADMRTTAGKRAVFRRNLAAILTLKELEREGRTASPEEQRLLASYSGFGGLSEVFDPANKAWSKEYDALQSHLTNEEYRAARSSILDAYYTPPDVAKAIYEGLQHLGFAKGNILEPSCGAGRFFAAMPEEMRRESHVCGVELDALSARIAAAAHPDVRVAAQGFETTRFADGSFDLAIGNVPFGETPITADPRYGGAGLLPHDYFIMKMLDEVRDGGLVAAITSSGTMDKLSRRTRDMLAERADLVTAMRLPAETFAGAGTAVTSDILVFRKKGDAQAAEEKDIRKTTPPHTWLNVEQKIHMNGWNFSEPHVVNRYYSDHHPEHVLGRWEERKGRYGTELSVAAEEGTEIRERIAAVFDEIPAGSVYTPAETELPIPMQAKEPDVRAMGFYLSGGALIYIDTDGKETAPTLDEKARARVISAVLLRDAGHAVLEVQQRGGSAEELRSAQKTLGELYDGHVKRYGHIAADRTLANVFYADPGYNFIRAYEITGNKGLIFATGTPISNAMTEIYTMQRYLAPHVLKELGLENFDAWAAAFADIAVSMELKPEGRGYQLKERFANFRNLPELMTSFKAFADVRTADMLVGDVAVPTAEIIVDKAPASAKQKAIIDDLVRRAEYIRSRRPLRVQRVDGTATDDSMLLITHAGRALSLDPRLVDADAPDRPDSKVNRCVKNLLDTYRATDEQRGTQILFCDESTSTGAGKGRFNVYDDVRDKLIAAGIPREEIAVVQEVADRDKQKLFDKVRSGEVRILIGSTGTLGVGTNVQDRLAALHDLSVPWRPADLEQRMGRIVRPGNQNETVKIFRYVTEGTFDAYLWQTVENKQKQIAQIMTSRSPLRSLQDMDETVLSYAELKAVATGNPFLREKMEIENRLGRIQLAKIDYETTRQKLQKFMAIDGPVRLKDKDAKIAGLMADKLRMDDAALKDSEGKNLFQMTLGEKIITDRDEAAKILMTAAKGGFTAAKAVKGSYRGMNLRILIDPVAMEPYLSLSGARTYRIGFSEKPEVTMRRLDALHDGIVKELKATQEERSRIAEDVKEAEEKIKKPFPYAAEEAEKKARLIEIVRQMEQGSDVAIAARATVPRAAVSEEPARAAYAR